MSIFAKWKQRDTTKMPELEYDRRTLFDWVIFIIFHGVLVGGIAYAAYMTYGARLGAWVGASAFMAVLVLLYLFQVKVAGETFMKIILGLAVACNAGYLVYNGAKAVGIDAFNSAQIKKFEVGVAAASRSTSRSIARQIGLNAKNASVLDRAFGDNVSVVAGFLSFLELAFSTIFLAIAMRRGSRIAEVNAPK